MVAAGDVCRNDKSPTGCKRSGGLVCECLEILGLVPDELGRLDAAFRTAIGQFEALAKTSASAIGEQAVAAV